MKQAAAVSSFIPLPSCEPDAREAAGSEHATANPNAATRQADFALVQRLVRREAGAWQTLVLRFERLVLARASATARELNQALADADAEDLCAEVFSRLVADDFAALRRFEGRCTLSTWLSVITRRIVARRLAAMRTDPARNSLGERSLDALAVTGSPEPWAALIQAEDRTRLAEGIAELAARHQELARLHYIEGCSYREISQRLAMPMNSIGPTLARIHEKLRKHMSGDES
jgi:RNA polymerase sigma-70 factor (ECF subfamily)